MVNKPLINQSSFSLLAFCCKKSHQAPPQGANDYWDHPPVTVKRATVGAGGSGPRGINTPANVDDSESCWTDFDQVIFKSDLTPLVIIIL